jgi:alanyl aminopeptidase
VTFAKTRPLSSYLLALAIGPIETVDAGAAGNQAPLRVLTPRGRAAEAAYTASILPEIVHRLEAYFDIPYPYDKLDDAAVPRNFGGAMENAGLIISGDTVLIASKTNLSDRFRETTASVLAHEVAHQWFGDLVTMAWWDDIWLNEAFATWMAHKVYLVRPEWQPEVEAAEARRRAMTADVLANARQIRQPIKSVDDMAGAFDDITYRKGATVIGMFERAVGPDKFRKGVHDYLAAHADGNGTTADFVAAISAAAGTDVAPAFSSFLDQPGLPAVALKVDCKGGKGHVELAQSRYLPVGSTGTPASWQIPVCIRAGAGKKTEVKCATLEATGEIALDFCPAWVHGNADAAGYYTVVYDAPALTEVVAADHLDLAEQLALVQDIALQLTGGTLPADRALDAFAHLATHAAPDTLAALAQAVDLIQDRGLVPGAQAAGFTAWVERVFGARARALGWRARPGEPAANRRLRAPLLTAVALHGRDKPLRDEARALADRWLEDKKTLDGDNAPAVLRVAAWTGDDPFLHRVLGGLGKATGQDRDLLVGMLYQFNDPVLIGRATQALLGDDIQIGDLLPIRRLALTGAARPGMLKFVGEHFDALIGKLGDFGGILLLSGLPLCDDESLATYRQLFEDKLPRLRGGPRAFAGVVERATLCKAARKAQEAPMAAYFKGK